MLRGSPKSQEWVLTAIGAIVLSIAVVVGYVVIANPFGGRPKDQIALAINTPYVGQGIAVGTAIVLHGVKVGEVSGITNAAGGGVRLATDVRQEPVDGLTTAMSIDFRPINYFGVPGVNLIPNPGGQPIRDGNEITLVPKGNFTLSQLLSDLGNVSEASLTPQLINVIDRVTRYTDGLNPLFETAVTVTRAVADVQTVPTQLLLRNTASAVDALPVFADAVVTAGTRFIDYSYYPGVPKVSVAEAAASVPQPTYPYLTHASVPNPWEETEEYYQGNYIGFLNVVSAGLFGSVGRLLYSHADDLLPLISGLKAITDTIPPLLRPADIAQKLAELRTRFETLYAGNGQQRAISVRVLLDSLPGVAAPIGIQTEGTP